MHIDNVMRNASLNAALSQDTAAAKNMVHKHLFALLVEKIIKLCRPHLIPRQVVAVGQEESKQALGLFKRRPQQNLVRF